MSDGHRGLGVRDVLALGQLLKDYEGTKFTCPDDEPEIKNHPMIRKWPNGEWTDCIRVRDWAAMKAYIERQQNRPAPVPGDSAEDKIIMEAMRTWTGRRRTRHDKYRGAPHLRDLRKVCRDQHQYGTAQRAVPESEGIEDVQQEEAHARCSGFLGHHPHGATSHEKALATEVAKINRSVPLME